MTGTAGARWHEAPEGHGAVGDGPREPGTVRSVPSPDDGGLDEVELTALALAADPDAPLAADAVPIDRYLAQLPVLLPDWYMPMAMARPGNRWRSAVVLAIVAAFLIIEALGLCSTFGQLTVG